MGHQQKTRPSNDHTHWFKMSNERITSYQILGCWSTGLRSVNVLTINQDTPTEESKEVKKLSLPQQLVAIYKYQPIWWRNIATTIKDLQKACQMKICSLFSPNNKGSS